MKMLYVVNLFALVNKRCTNDCVNSHRKSEILYNFYFSKLASKISFLSRSCLGAA